MSTPSHARAFLLCPEMFEDPRLSSLRSSRPNRQLMFDALADERHGVCDRLDITVMSNEPNSVVQPRLEQWFRSATDDDVLVFYYSGHGLAEDGELLRLATATAGEQGSHAVSGHELASWIGRCRARLVYVIVDALHPGPQDVRTDGRVHQIIGSGDGVVADSPVGQPSPFTLRIAGYFGSDPDPSLEGLFRWLQGAERRVVAAQPIAPLSGVPEQAEPVLEPFAGPIVELTAATTTATAQMAETPPLGSPVPMTTPVPPAVTVPPVSSVPPASPVSPAPPLLTALPAEHRRRRRWTIAGWAALVLVVGVAGALTRCGGDDEDAGSTTPTSIASTGPTSGSTETSTVGPATTIPASVTAAPAPTTTEAVPSASTTVVASEPATTAAPTTTVAPGPATIELGIPNHPLATPACTGGWIAQLASVDSTSEFAKASVTELLETSGTSYTYAPDSCSTFDKGGKWYVVYLGPYATKDDALEACAESGDEDCFARQLQ